MPESAASTTVAELILEHPARMGLFERLGIDYCCGGKRPLAEVCGERGLDPATFAALLEALDETETDEEAAGSDWAHAPLGELCDHILDHHHAYLRRELPRLTELTDKAARAHGDELPELHAVEDAFIRLRAELETHLDDEERALFPACRRLQAGETADDAIALALASLDALETEHAAAGKLLATIREQTHDFDHARARCNTHRALLASLAELERDLHEHIHEENNILFPRALALLGG